MLKNTVKTLLKNAPSMSIGDLKNNNKDIEVTIICNTYNHKNYIKKCLDGFLMQKVDFSVQIIIHDDASNDGTTEILKEYKEKYPHIIDLILEDENLYSVDRVLIQKKIIAKVKGKYIANCEGDDYWTDPHKIYIQYKLMQANQDCSYCVHKVVVNNLRNGEKTTYPKFKLRTKKMSSKKFINIINNSYAFQTSSYFRRSSDYINYINNKPEFAKIMPNGDEANLLYYGSLGNAIFIDREMSVYNKFTESSWSNSSLKYSKEDKIKRSKRICESLLAFDEFTNHKYHSSVMRRYYGSLYTISKQENKAKETFISNKKFRHYLLFNRFWLYCYCVLKYIL